MISINLLSLTCGVVTGLAVLGGPLRAQVVSPPTSIPVEETLTRLFAAGDGPCELSSEGVHENFRLILEYDATEESAPSVIVHRDHAVSLPPGENRRVEIAYEQLEGTPVRVRTWHEGKEVGQEELKGSLTGGADRHVATPEESGKTFRFDRDATFMVRFRGAKGGSLVAKAPAAGEWARDAKVLFIRGGRLAYDIGWLGQVSGKNRVVDGKEHVAVLVLEDGGMKLFVDGELDASKKDFGRPDRKEHVFKIGAAAPDFGRDFEGELLNVRTWKRALSAEEARKLSTGREDEVNTPDFNWTPSEAVDAGDAVEGSATRVRLKAGAGFRLKTAELQPLATADHGALVAGWDDDSLKRGAEIYKQLCVTCHGTLDQAGSLPTALRFHEGEFRNGSDPYRMFQTLHKGYGMMVPQPQYSTQQKYDVIHYVREHFLKDKNPSQYVALDEEYQERLPRGLSLRKESAKPRNVPQYKLQDFGNMMMWTFQVEDGNIAQKGIAVRVDDGPGGITKGRSWMLYEQDTMRLAACWTGDQFVDWKGIAWDGSHGTHTSIAGEKHFVSPDAPGWANPATGGFEDVRIRGRDDRPYGPLPRAWMQFRSATLLGDRVLLTYTVGDREVREIPTRNRAGQFERVMAVGPSTTPLTLRLDGNKTHMIPASAEPHLLSIVYANGTAKVGGQPSLDLPALAKKGGTRRFPGVLATEIERGADEGPFAVDVLTTPPPDSNPWQSWMRTSGFDFFKGGKSAAVCTWNGDVWIVDGIDQSEGTLQWQRICAGLFQPLGLRIVNGEIYVGCRDMIARLRDLDGDRETDVIEAFNSDHQVTEHFHEFAMGLQTDEEGNFYYAKSARHALKAVVPHHGTLLKVSKDGSTTTILATGFRAANGVCLNPDGTFIVTDQEGHWNPKNRINWVQGKGVDDFYGNMYGYHGITDESDEAMTPPLCWITNGFDRSPAELLWVPEDSAWKSLRGSLLNLSYGYGKIYVVPHERVNGQVQGGMSPLPIPQSPTGVMRGRFHPGDGQLYTCGMFAWAGNQRQPGGFYRVRATGQPAHAPVGLATSGQTVKVSFTDPLDRESSENPRAWTVEAWDLKRTKSYGSKHFNQRRWAVEKASLSEDGRTISLTIPELAPTWGMMIRCKVKGRGGEDVEREIHNTIHAVGP